MGSEGSHIVQELGITTAMFLFSNCAVPKREDDPTNFHSQIQENMITVHSWNHHQLGLVLGLSQIPGCFEDGPIKLGLSMSQKGQPGGDTLPLSGDWNGGYFLLGLGTGFVKIGHVGLTNDINQ